MSEEGPAKPERTPSPVRRLGAADAAVMPALLTMFGTAFDDPQGYGDARPDCDYLVQWLANDHVVALAVFDGDAVVGGLVGYLLPKAERARSELYIYDLAVDVEYRRRGIATALIGHGRRIARENGVSTIFVQADRGDHPAIALYTKLGAREDVIQFDILP